MRWVRATMGVVSLAAGLFCAYRAVGSASHHDYVLTLAATIACVAALRAGTTLLSSEVAE